MERLRGVVFGVVCLVVGLCIVIGIGQVLWAAEGEPISGERQVVPDGVPPEQFIAANEAIEANIAAMQAEEDSPCPIPDCDLDHLEEPIDEEPPVGKEPGPTPWPGFLGEKGEDNITPLPLPILEVEEPVDEEPPVKKLPTPWPGFMGEKCEDNITPQPPPVLE